MEKIKDKINLKYILIVSIIVLVILITQNRALAYHMSYTEKEEKANKMMYDIEDYRNELNDKGHPDFILDELYHNATTYYLELNLVKLEEIASLAKERKNRVLKINSFIEKTKENIDKFDNDERLNTTKYKQDMINISKLVLNRQYDQAYTLAIDIETDLELIALDYILESELIVKELKDNQLPSSYLSDRLKSIKDAFKPLETTELSSKLQQLNNNLKKNYGLGLIRDVKTEKVEFIDYSLILKGSEEIKYRRDQILEINTKTKEIENKIKTYATQEIDTSDSIKSFNKSITYFKDENFDKSEFYIVEAETKLESAKAHLTVTRVIAKESIWFIKRNWKKIIVIILIISILGHITTKKRGLTF